MKLNTSHSLFCGNTSLTIGNKIHFRETFLDTYRKVKTEENMELVTSCLLECVRRLDSKKFTINDKLSSGPLVLSAILTGKPLLRDHFEVVRQIITATTRRTR